MWIKKGLIHSNCHAQLPTVEVCDDLLRIYFSEKINNVSFINYIEVDKDNPKNLIYKNLFPVLSPGMRGCFDDSGVMPSCIIGNILYYTGWNVDKGGVPYGHGIGTVTREDKIFVRKHLGPILDRSIDEPFLCNSAFAVDNIVYYCSGTGWEDNFPTYQIACRKDGVKFVYLANSVEAMSRPCVIKDEIYRMWVCCRCKNTPYEMHYAESQDGLKWKFTIGPIIGKSLDGWDSEMICYPYVVSVGEKRYMFYNGNGYGASGIGYAEWE